MRLPKRPTAPIEVVEEVGPFPHVEIPADVLTAARRAPDGIAGMAVVEAFLRDVHGPMPDHRDDRKHWLAWIVAVEERALGFLEDGLLA